MQGVAMGRIGNANSQTPCKNSECDLSHSGFSNSSNHREKCALPRTITEKAPHRGAKIINKQPGGQENGRQENKRRAGKYIFLSAIFLSADAQLLDERGRFTGFRKSPLCGSPPSSQLRPPDVRKV